MLDCARAGEREYSTIVIYFQEKVKMQERGQKTTHDYADRDRRLQDFQRLQSRTGSFSGHCRAKWVGEEQFVRCAAFAVETYGR